MKIAKPEKWKIFKGSDRTKKEAFGSKERNFFYFSGFRHQILDLSGDLIENADSF